MTEQEAKEMIRQTICSSSKCNDSCLYGKNRCQYEMAMSAMEEVQQYRALGTVEELKEAKEKQIEKEPIWSTSDFVNRHHCPSCDGIICVEQPHCGYCGQKLDWRNEDAE